MGSLFILLLYSLIIFRLINIGNLTRSSFGKLYCYSFATAFFICCGKYGHGIRPFTDSGCAFANYVIRGSSMIAIMFGLGVAMSCKIYKDTQSINLKAILSDQNEPNF